jgi:peptidoglycan LD-endopeptidase LytH
MIMQKKFILLALVVAVVVAAATLYFMFRRGNARGSLVLEWIKDPTSHPDLKMTAGTRCGDAPFIFPTDGMIGFIWDDSFRPGHRHQGIDIFAGTDPGLTRVIAAYPGYLTRKPDWKSSIIVRVPDDPLQAGRQVWLYYTHMANLTGIPYIAPEFPPGTSEVFIEAGTFLGYQGNYSGDSNNPVGVHLHFSIVKDDGSGNFLNELELKNTYDPSPYLGLSLNANENKDAIPVCK